MQTNCVNNHQKLCRGTLMQTVTFGAERSPHPDLTLGTLCHLSCVIHLCLWMFQTFTQDFSVPFVDLVFLLSRAPV